MLSKLRLHEYCQHHGQFYCINILIVRVICLSSAASGVFLKTLLERLKRRSRTASKVFLSLLVGLRFNSSRVTKSMRHSSSQPSFQTLLFLIGTLVSRAQTNLIDHEMNHFSHDCFHSYAETLLHSLQVDQSKVPAAILHGDLSAFNESRAYISQLHFQHALLMITNKAFITLYTLFSVWDKQGIILRCYNSII